MKKIRQYLLTRFLPQWAKNTVLAENERLRRELAAARQENSRLRAYALGLRAGARLAGRREIREE